MRTRDPRANKFNVSRLDDPMNLCPPRVQQSPALNSVVTDLKATQATTVEHM